MQPYIQQNIGVSKYGNIIILPYLLILNIADDFYATKNSLIFKSTDFKIGTIQLKPLLYIEIKNILIYPVIILYLQKLFKYFTQAGIKVTKSYVSEFS